MGSVPSFLRAAGARHLAGRLTRDHRGAIAVEFALVALPFIAMIMAVFELALLLTISTTLDSATARAARQIRTGQLQSTTGANADSFKSQICGNLGWMGSQCLSNLSVDVRFFPNGVQDASNCLTGANPNNDPNLKCSANDPPVFQTGGAGDVVLVRANYKWQLFTPFLNGGLTVNSDGTTTMTSTIAFKNEPYSIAGGG